LDEFSRKGVEVGNLAVSQVVGVERLMSEEGLSVPCP